MSLSQLPHYALAMEAVSRAPDDPENTLMVQLTTRELCSVFFGLLLLNNLFPETAFIVDACLAKLEELSEAQEFLPRIVGLDADDVEPA